MMKKTIIIIAALLNALLIYSQDLMVAEQIDASNISIDQDKNIIVKGIFIGTFDFDFSHNKVELTSSDDGAYSDHFIASYDSLLNYRWAFSFFGAITGNNVSSQTDSLGNIYISDYAFNQVDFDPSPDTAYLENTLDGYGPFMAKYDNHGNFQWVKPYDCKLIKIIGQHLFGFSNSKMFKYDLEGRVLWEKDLDYCTEPVLLGDRFYTLQHSERYSPGELTVHTIDTAGNMAQFIELARSDNSQFEFGRNNPLAFVNNKMVIMAKYWGDIDMDPGVDSFMIHNAEMESIYHQGEYQLDVPTLKSFVAAYHMDGTLLSVKEYEGSHSYPLTFKNDHQGNVYSIGIFKDSINLGMTESEVVYISADAYASYLAEYDSSFQFISAVKLSESESTFNLNHPLFKYLHFDPSQTIIVGKYENLNLNQNFYFTNDNPRVQIAIYQNFEIPFLGIPENEGFESSFLVYPVPTGDQIIIEFADRVYDCSLNIYNINGQVLLNSQLGEKRNQISLKAFSSGVYFVQIKTPYRTEIRRIIKN